MKKKCKKCGKCCTTTMGPFVFPDDILSICDFLKLKPKVFVIDYCIINTIVINEKRINIISIRCNENGCIFLNNNLCEIYPVRPFQCKNAPYKFLGYYEFWEHMPCVSEKDFKNIDTSKTDKEIFKKALLNYEKYLKEEL